MWPPELVTPNTRLHVLGKSRQTSTSSWLRNIINYYFVIVLVSFAGDEGQQVAAAAVCASGPPGPTQKISSLSAEHLANGTLATSTMAEWDFEGPGVILSAPLGVNISLSCMVATNATIAAPPAELGFLQPTAIQLANATGLAMDGVSLITDCQTVLDYQNYLCSSYSAAGGLTLEQGVVYFSSWHDGFTSLENVTLKCTEPASAPALPCRLTAVVTTRQLLGAFTDYVPAAESNVTIIMAANISIVNGSWPDSPVPVGRNVSIVGSARLHRPVLDFNLLVSLWEVEAAVIVDIVNLTCINLAPTYLPPAEPAAMFSMLTNRMWAFKRHEQQVHLHNITMVVLLEELSYLRYWVTFVVSPVPEAQARAAWLRVIDIKIGAVNDSGLYYDHIYSFTTVYYNVRVADPAGSGFTLQPLELGLKQLQAETVALSGVRQVINAADLLAALALNTSFAEDEKGRQWELLIGNMSMADDTTWNRDTGIRVSSSTVLGRGPGRCDAYLGLANQPNTFIVPDGTMLTARNLVLCELAPRRTTYDPAAPLDLLASPVWGVGLEGTGSRMRLENTTLLISAAEVALLQRCLLHKQAADTLQVPASYDAALVAAVQAFFLSEDVLRPGPYGPSYLTIASGVTQRYEVLGVTFRAPAGDEHGRIAAANVTLPGAESGGSGGFAGWKVGVIVGCVGATLLLIAVVATILYRRRRAPGETSDPGARQLAAYEKYLRSSADPGVRQYPAAPPAAGGGTVFDLPVPLPSNELTNSSQELRPGARTSDVEAAGGIAALKLPCGTAYATASGGLGRSRSTTAGSPSPNNSSGAGLTPVCATGGGGGGTSISGSGSGSALQGSHSGTGSAIRRHGGPHHHRNVPDSFDQPPSSTMLGQHGPVGRETGGGRHSSVVTSNSQASTGVSQGGGGIMASTGGAALDQMHAMIQVLGRQFNDRQLEISSLLGKGAHGTVYRGTWRGLPVAIKSMIFSSDANVRHQQRPLVEAAISSNLAHPNIVTTYAYELREVEHEMASLSPELARQGGGWRLLIIQEYCDAGPLRRIVDCGFFLAPHKASSPRRKSKRPGAGLKERMSSSAPEGSVSGSARDSHRGAPDPPSVTAPAAAAAGSSSSSPDSSASNGAHGVAGSSAAAVAQSAPDTSGGQGGSTCPSSASRHGSASLPRVLLEDLPPDVPLRPGSGLEAAVRYVEAALIMARGLQHIHDKNIVHGDLNPNNVLLVRQPNTPLGFCLKVADFGLSVRMAEGESHMSNLCQGSPYYCAPEVVLSGKVGKPSDIYSLGIMMWELQNGTRPPWRMGVRLRTYPSLNTGELDFGPDAPPRYTRLARECFHGSKDARPGIGYIVDTLVEVKAELESLMGV